MRIPQDAISTQKKKKRINPLAKIPAGGYVLLLLLVVWSGGAWLGAWLESEYHVAEPASLNPEVIPVESKDNKIRQINESSQVDASQAPAAKVLVEQLNEALDMQTGRVEIDYDMGQLSSVAAQLDSASAYAVQGCSVEAEQNSSWYRSTGFARAANTAAALQALNPTEFRVKQTGERCRENPLVSLKPNQSTDRLNSGGSLRVDLAATGRNLGELDSSERLFFEDSLNAVLGGSELLILVHDSQSAVDLPALLLRFVEQGFAAKNLKFATVQPTQEGSYLEIHRLARPTVSGEQLNKQVEK